MNTALLSPANSLKKFWDYKIQGLMENIYMAGSFSEAINHITVVKA